MTFANTILALLDLEVFLYMLLGIVLGMILGALPGFTGSMGIALLIPITYTMEPVPALVMLMAIYTSGIYGGSISAILLHTPGAPSSAATADDGYALTVQGKGLQALGVSTVCSCLGGFISGLALICIAPWLANICLYFGPAEKFMVAIFGLTIIGSLCSGGVIKGLLAGALGLAISCIGVDAQTGYPRFMYGNDYLAGGLATIPVLIGLFSLSQVFLMSETHTGSNKAIVDKALNELHGRTLPPLREMMGLIIPTIRSAIIGVGVGIMPGAGGDIASFLAVNIGKQSSKHPEEYGKGSMEAVACSEAANNAVSGGAMIPLLTLSIPGAATAALLLGGFTMHGLVPGSELFTTQADIVYPILSGFTFSNIVMGIIGLIAARYVARVVSIPMSILAPVIMVMATLGCYSVNLSFLDVWSMVIFGMIGYIMVKHQMVTSPIVLAIILGPIAEQSLLQSLTLARSTPILAYYASRPIVLVMVALSIFSILWTVMREKKISKKAKEAQSA